MSERCCREQAPGCLGEPYAPRAYYCEHCRLVVLVRQRRDRQRELRRAEGRPVRDYAVCQNCHKRPPRVRFAKWCLECHVAMRRIRWHQERVRLNLKRKAQVRDLLALATSRLNRMLSAGELDGNTIRAIGRTLAQVHVDGEDRWRQLAAKKSA